ncbi:MAG TPA: hypothetical protein DEG96_07475 [Candidatus Atribacteria bacterium]|uniref:Aldehyde ferredoxin oxidoreductase n=1 Tax=candidate division TA06 bacterium 34_109 TaxID=1635277 RepID=A0A124G037_UNCT6|nr:MAG: Aldehyde ferredoxin oxidoreductase [candidate division TA06 bacterium 34_109]HBY57679.1 hypothetical protein [Candidatus Atribacteria bacterium]
MALTAYIDLSKKNIEINKSPAPILEEYLGSRGYAAKILYDNVDPEIGAFDAGNCLIFSTGLFTGTCWPTSARFTVTAKSPATGAYGYANAGGYFGVELRKAGFDALVINGKSEKPVYLLVKDEQIVILPANEYWGRNTADVNNGFKKIYEGSHVLSIGPAGENLVKMASIITDDYRALARTGMGAVMGSKKLKAIVVKASKKITFSEEFRKIAIESSKKISNSQAAQDYHRWGTAVLIDYKNKRGDLPAKNHLEVQIPFANKINAQALDKYVIKTSGCYNCPIRCERHSQVKLGPYKCETAGPEYETINGFGSMVWNDDIELIIYANKLCNDLGLDTISTSGVIAFAMECHEKGFLSNKEYNLKWGDKESIVGLIKKIAYRDGIGDILAEGALEASKKIYPDTFKFAMQVKGVEIPEQEPRTNRGLALGHATSNRGADHLYGLETIDQTHNEEVAKKYFPGSGPEILDVFSQKYKPEMLKFTEAYSAISDALGICKFSTLENYVLGPDDIAKAINAFDNSFDLEEKDLLKIGERIVNLERVYNCRHGFDRKNDSLPERFLKEPATVYKVIDGMLTNQVWKSNLLVDLEEMLDGYYKVRGWDFRGIPTQKKLKELGLFQLIEDL